MSHLLIHRGLAKKNFNENTISAFKYCFKKKYGIETDIHCTKDRKIVCFHDFNLKGKFKINKSLKNIKYQDLLKISKAKKKPIPLLNDLIKLSKNKRFLMLEIKPLFTKKNHKTLLKEIKNLKNYSLTSFKEKNIINLYKMKKSLNLGLLIPSTFTFNRIIEKSKKKYVKFLVLEKKFLKEKKLDKIKKKVYFYTIKDKKLFNQFNNKNLIFENL
jgi:glycerophosphoryl diester phosphodiesterase